MQWEISINFAETAGEKILASSSTIFNCPGIFYVNDQNLTDLTCDSLLRMHPVFCLSGIFLFSFFVRYRLEDILFFV